MGQPACFRHQSRGLEGWVASKVLPKALGLGKKLQAGQKGIRNTENWEERGWQEGPRIDGQARRSGVWGAVC